MDLDAYSIGIRLIDSDAFHLTVQSAFRQVVFPPLAFVQKPVFRTDNNGLAVRDLVRFRS